MYAKKLSTQKNYLMFTTGTAALLTASSTIVVGIMAVFLAFPPLEAADVIIVLFDIFSFEGNNNLKKIPRKSDVQ